MINQFSPAGIGLVNGANINKQEFKEKMLNARITVDEFYHQMNHDPYVRVNGKNYYIKEVPASKHGIFSILPLHSKAVVEIGDKEYPVKMVKDPIACDKKKAVVVVDGKVYSVKGGKTHPGGNI